MKLEGASKSMIFSILNTSALHKDPRAVDYLYHVHTNMCKKGYNLVHLIHRIHKGEALFFSRVYIGC